MTRNMRIKRHYLFQDVGIINKNVIYKDEEEKNYCKHVDDKDDSKDDNRERFHI